MQPISEKYKKPLCVLIAVLMVLLVGAVFFSHRNDTHRVFPGDATRSMQESTAISNGDGGPAVSANAASRSDRSSISPFLPEPLEGSRLLIYRETPSHDRNQVRREFLLESDFTYPYLKIVEEVAIDPSTLEETLSAQTVMVADHMIVRLKDDASESDLMKLNKKYGTSIRKKMLAPQTYIVEFKDVDLDVLDKTMEAFKRESDRVSYSEPDFIMFSSATIPDDYLFEKQWGMHNASSDHDIDAPEAWDITTGSEDIVIGIVDSGIVFDHPDLVDNVFFNKGEVGLDLLDRDKRFNGIDDDGNGFVDDWRGWDFIDNDNDPTDDYFHGTFTAGIAGARGNNGIGVAGVTWKSKILVMRIIGSQGAAATSLATDAIYYGAQFGMKVSCNSYGGSGYSQTVYDAIEYGNQQNQLFVAAAGNDIADNDVTPHYPSSYTNENVIAVLGTDGGGRKWGVSSYGATSVDIGARAYFVYSTTLGREYNWAWGTSFATPHIVGAAALLWSIDQNADNLAIRDAMYSSVDHLTNLVGLCVTEGRLNVFNAIKALGLHVATTDPAKDEVVASQRTDFTIHFTEAYLPATIQASDLVVNGIAANSTTLADSNTVTFHFSASPVTSEGMQSMAMATGVVARLSDGGGLHAWTNVFRYDALPLAVVSATPVDDTTIAPPLTQLTFDFNEAIDTSTVRMDDLVLSQGRVVNVQLLDADTVQFSLTGVDSEAIVSVEIPAGAFTDLNGAPSVAYTGSYRLDVDTITLVSPLRSAPPLGSLAYTSSVSAELHTAVDQDHFTLTLDGDQVLTVVATPEAALQPRLELWSPSSTLIASASAIAGGQDAVIQLAPTAVAGTYSIRAASVANQSVGQYKLSITVNGADEAEEHGGASNDLLAGAQDVDESFITAKAGASRAYVAGALYAPEGMPIYSEDFESGALGGAWSTYSSNETGRIQITGEHGVGGGFKALLMDKHVPDYNNHILNEAIWTVDLSGLTNAFLRFKYARWNDEGYTMNGPYEGHYTYDGVALSANGSTWYPLWSRAKTAEGQWSEYVIDLASAISTTPLAFGPNMRIKFSQVDNMTIPEDGIGWDDVAITVPVADKDLYRFSLAAGQLTSLALEHRKDGNLTVELLNSVGSILAVGSSHNHNVASAIQDFSAPYTGTYYARVTGDTAYGLVITRGSGFDIELNDERIVAEDFSQTGVAIGQLAAMVPSITSESEPNDDGNVGGLPEDLLFANDLSGSFFPTGGGFYAEITGSIDDNFDQDWDFFKISAGPGDVLEVNMRGTDSGGGTLYDPHLRLYDRNANELANVEDGGVSRDALLVYSNFSYGGEYYIVADAEIVWMGTYTLSASITAPVLAGPDTADTYEMAFAAGDRIKVETVTPASAPHSFGNTLDPLVEVYNPAGTLVASNDNGAPDGRNALLVHAAASSGTYAFRILTAAGAGPYALSAELEPLAMVLPQDASENDGLAVNAGRVNIESVLGGNLIVSLSSDDTSELSVPSSVTVFAGQTSATFNITYNDDAILDGTKIVRVTASAAGFADGESDVAVHDSESTSLSILAPAFATEGDGVLSGQGRVNLANPVQDHVVLALHSTDSTEVVLPSTVSLSIGQTTTVFDVTIVDDNEIDGLQNVLVTTAVTNWINGSTSINVADNESRVLALNVPAQSVEGQGTLIGAGMASIPGTLTTDLTITLLSTDASEVTVPLSIILPAGQTSALFNITVQDDSTADGAQVANISAAAATFTGTSVPMTILDNEFHHLTIEPIASPQIRGQAFDVMVSARAVDNQVILNYAATASIIALGDSASYLPVLPSSLIDFADGVWTGAVTINHVDANVRLKVSDTTGNHVDSNPFDIDGAICSIEPAHLSNTFVQARNANTRSLTIRNDGTMPLSYTITIPELTSDLFRVGSVVSEGNDKPSRIDVGDVDGDGTPDIVAPDYNQHTISWWKPQAPGTALWQKHVVVTDFWNATSVAVDDIDDDGDLDILGTSRSLDDVVWWENVNGSGLSWQSHTISSSYLDPTAARLVDVDGDGDLDALAVAQAGDRIDWWENLNGQGTSWAQHAVDASYDAPSHIDSMDMDNDGDIDVVGCTLSHRTITWWENLNSNGTSWAMHTVDTNLLGVASVAAVDFDGDNDGDIIAGTSVWPLNGGMYWRENLDGAGTSWSQQVIRAYWPSVVEVSTDDINLDGHPDVLAASFRWPGWWSNKDGTGTNLQLDAIDDTRNVGAERAGDFDLDGDIDIVGGSYSNGVFIWKNNRIVDWIHIDEWSGTIPAGGVTNIDVFFDASTFPTNAHEETSLIVTCNDLLAPSNDLLVHMEVLDALPPPALNVEPVYTLGSDNLIAWSAVQGASQYWVDIFAATNLPATGNSGWVSSTDYTFNGLGDGITYYYRAKSGINTASGLVESAWSPWVYSLQLHGTNDYDGDGIATSWEEQLGFDPLDSSDGLIDLDLDGLDNRGEYLADTDPFDLYSTLEILSVQNNLGTVSVEWQGGVEAWQYLLFKSDMASATWTTLYTNQPPTSVTNLFQYNTGISAGFYRIQTHR